MPAPVVVLAHFGAVGVIAGAMALISKHRLPKKARFPANWPTTRKLALVAGIVVGAATWPLTYFMGYPISSPDGPGRMVGVPVFVACFDSAGRDYVGPLTVPGAIPNVVFWTLPPQLILYVYGWRLRS